jgi:spore germination protein GerM
MSRSLSRRGSTPVLLAALASALVACGVRAESDARFVDNEQVPFDLLDGTTTRPSPTAAPEGATSSIELCFVDGDDRLVPSSRPARPGAEVAEVTQQLAEGPNRLEAAVGLRSALPDGAVAGRVESAGGIAEVDLVPSFTDIGGEQQLLAIAQVVCTLTARPGIGQVAFTLDGSPIAVPRGDASTTTDPLTRDDYRSLITAPQ